MKKIVFVMAMHVMLSWGLAAQAITWKQWSGNGHWYALVNCNSKISWEAARIDAETNGGYLVTITSAAEDSYVSQLMYNEKTMNAEKYWLGGYQPENSVEPSGGWSWVSGEEWIYSNWSPGQPSNSSGIQHYLHYWPEGTWEWDDMYNDYTMTGYVIETVPEPSSIIVLMSGFAGIVGLVFRRYKT